MSRKRESFQPLEITENYFAMNPGKKARKIKTRTALNLPPNPLSDDDIQSLRSEILIAGDKNPEEIKEFNRHR